jgi:hypothetical protein
LCIDAIVLTVRADIMSKRQAQGGGQPQDKKAKPPSPPPTGDHLVVAGLLSPVHGLLSPVHNGLI